MSTSRLEPGEDWAWCFPDELAMRIPRSTDTPHPAVTARRLTRSHAGTHVMNVTIIGTGDIARGIASRALADGDIPVKGARR